MYLLLAVSLLWALSPGLIKGQLAGLDSAFISTARLFLALLVFLPFLRFKGVTLRAAAALTGIGAVQFGLMYLAYNESFRYLPAHQVALFTITTPILVTLFADAFDRTFHRYALFAALLAVAGTAVMVVDSRSLGGTIKGFALVQLSNAAFALGQVLYRRVSKWPGMRRDRDVFGLLYLGGFIVAFVVLYTRHISVTLEGPEILTLLYLGVLASGLGFFLWNRGATQVNAGTLAVLNNAKIPLMVACSLIFFGETASLPRLAVSLALLTAAVWLAEKRRPL